MRIRNLKPYALGLSYAGPRKGFTLKPGGLSPELPSDRFYHPQLQTDWKRGYIDIVVSETDKAVLGSTIEAFDATPLPAKQPQPTGPTAQSIKKVLQKRAEEQQAARNSETTNYTADANDTAPNTEPTEFGKDVTEPIEDDYDDIVEEADACERPDCTTADVKIKYDERVGCTLCQYCRQQVTRRRNKRMKEDPTAMASDLYPAIAEDMELPIGYADEDPQEQEPTLPEKPRDEAPVESFGYGVSLSDLNKE